MADKKQFLIDLRSHADTVQRWLDDLTSNTDQRNRAIGVLKENRNKIIETLVNELLPSLDNADVAKLQQRLPGILSAEDIRLIHDSEVASIQSRITRNFVQSDYENGRHSLADRVDQENGKAKKYADELNKVSDVKSLVERGYGTDQYKVKFYQAQYYADWRRADEIAEEMHVGSWEEVRHWYDDLDLKRSNAVDAANRAQSSIVSLDEAYQQHADLQKELANVNVTVLEKARIRVRAAIDTLTDNPSWMSKVRDIDKEILDQQAELTKLQEQRRPMSEELTKLQKLYADAAKSPQKTVPDQYANMLRTQRTQYHGGYRGGSGGSDNNWMLTYLFYDHLFNHFGGSSHHHGGDVDPSYHTTQAAPQAVEQNARYGS